MTRPGAGPPPEHPPREDPIAQGARARAMGRPRDACPHPIDSAERRIWLEGYDGMTDERPAGRPPEGA